MNKKLLLIGAGGHCKSIIDTLLINDEYIKIGIIDKEHRGDKVLGIPVIGNDNDLKDLYSEGYKYAFIAVGSVGNPNLRIKLFNKVKDMGFTIPNIIDVSATLSKFIQLEEGIFIGKNTVINAGVNIQKAAIINTGTIIEHDCEVGSFCHLAPGSVICGDVTIGNNTHVGAGSVIKQQLKIGSNTVIGIGSVVTKNINDNVLAYGNVCKEVKTI